MDLTQLQPGEQERLSRIETTNQELLASINAFSARSGQYIAAGMSTPSGDFPGFIAQLERFDRALTGLASPTSAAITHRIALIQPDLRKAIDIYRDMYAQARAAEGQRAAIVADANSYTASAMSDVHNRIQQGFAAANQKWQSYFKG